MKEPGRHGSHDCGDCMPLPVWYVPAPHAWQIPLPFPNVPAPHAWHSPLPFANVPAPHAGAVSMSPVSGSSVALVALAREGGLIRRDTPEVSGPA